MSFKTILVYLNDKSASQHVLAAAVTLAQRHDAHLIGLHVDSLYQVHSIIDSDARAEIAEVQKKSMQFEAADIEGIFNEYTRKEGISSEWRLVQSHSALIAEAVINHARCADVIVAGQPNPNHDDAGVSNILEGFLIDSGRPLLVVPYAGNFSVIGDNVALAWNASRESARAAFSALPVLKRAKTVSVLWINAKQDSGNAIDLPGSEIATTLARHGVVVETKHSAMGLPEVGDEILSNIADMNTDLLVMGAYGHSRLREFIFGGASRHILLHMTVPVLLVH